MANVRFLSVKLKSTFDNLETKDKLALYWIEETKEIYKGDTLYGTGALATKQVAGLLSPEDYAKLQELVDGGGLKNLIPVDGSIVLADKPDGCTSIGVGLSAVEGNMLSIQSDGLYVAKTKVPEYSIEKQTTAEDGYSATYKLKRTLDGVDAYVGDAINIAKDMVLQGATLETVTIVDVPYAGAVIGDPYIDMAFNDAEQSHIYIPVKSLVDTYTAGQGIDIVDGKISVKIADDSHGLVAVNGTMSMLLATAQQDGAMSKEDKAFIDAIPYAYVSRKYDVSDTPEGTLVNYGEKEIRIMCPANAEFAKQAVGTGGDENTYYVTFRTYAPSDDVVGYIEHLGGQSDAEILMDIKTDKYGRRYQPTWLGVAKFDEATETWNYYGKNSSIDKFIGWDYQIDWYDANNKLVASDCVRINLSNEACHNEILPYYMNKYATNEKVSMLEETVSSISDSFAWSEM